MHSSKINPPTGISIRGDIVGPPNPISNIRPITFHIPHNETSLERRFRIKKEEVHNWHEEFWKHHNKKFMAVRISYFIFLIVNLLFVIILIYLLIINFSKIKKIDIKNMSLNFMIGIENIFTNDYIYSYWALGCYIQNFFFNAVEIVTILSITIILSRLNMYIHKYSV